MSDIEWTIKPSDIEWTMDWKDRPSTPEFASEGALALMLLNQVVFLNSLHWEKECPERVRNLVACCVNCNDIFAWGCADAEELPYDQIEPLWRMWMADPRWGAAKWCILRRNQQPQGPVEKLMREAGVWDEKMEAAGKNTMDAELHAMIGAPVPEYVKGEYVGSQANPHSEPK
jgi:hypothetical protein